MQELRHWSTRREMNPLLTCPVCRSSRVRRRKRRTFQVLITMLFGKNFYRCGTCGHEFERQKDERPPGAPAKPDPLRPPR